MQGKGTDNLVRKARRRDPNAFTELMQLYMTEIRKSTKILKELEEYEEPSACDEYNLELKEALALLDEKYRIVMTLFYSEGYHIDEIAKILDIPKSTVQTRLKRAREKLARDYYGIERKV